MALRDILVYLDQSEHAFERLHLAADLARRHQSQLTALYVRELSPVQRHQQSIAELGQGSAQAISKTNRQIRHSIDEAIERLRATLKEIERRYQIEIEWRCIEGAASITVPQHARFADLCVLSQDVSETTAATGYTFSEQLLFVAGRPVIFVPARGTFKTLGQHILVAWNSSRAAARAVNDALPLIERAQQVTVLAVNPARLWEKLMGGVTRDLLAGMQLPILMSY